MIQTEKSRRPGVRRGPKSTAQDSPVLLEDVPATVSERIATERIAPERIVPDVDVSEQTAPASKRGGPRKAKASAAPAASVADAVGGAKDDQTRGKSGNGKAEVDKHEHDVDAASLNAAAPKRGRGRPIKKKPEAVEDAAPASLEEVPLQPSLSAKPEEETAPAAKTTETSGGLARVPPHHKDAAAGPGRASNTRPKTSLLKGRVPERPAFKPQAQNAAAPAVPAAIASEAANLEETRGVPDVKAARTVSAEKESNGLAAKAHGNKKNAMEQFYARAYAKKDNYPAEKAQSLVEQSAGVLPGKARQNRHSATIAGLDDSLPLQKSEIAAARDSDGRSDVLNSSDNKSVNFSDRERRQKKAGIREGERPVRPVGSGIGDESQDKREVAGKAAGRLPRPLRAGSGGRGGKNISSAYRSERAERFTEENVEISGKSADWPEQSARPARHAQSALSGQSGQSDKRFEMRKNTDDQPEREALPRPGRGGFKPGRGTESRTESRSRRESEPGPTRDAAFPSGQGAAFKTSDDAAFKPADENLRNNPRRQKAWAENLDHDKTDKDNRRGRISNWPLRPARPPKDGIKASSKGFVESWWGRSWLSSLEEALGHSSRLQRGRQYAKAGHVTQIMVEKCRVKATVCGNHVYYVHFRLSPLNFKAWSIIGRVLGSQAALAARLLNGELPEEIHHGLARAGLSLMPDFGSELSTQCSCPDKSNPCKHIAAVHYLLAEEIDRDPFLLLCLRGKEREEVITLMAGQSGRKLGLSKEAVRSAPGRRRLLGGGLSGADASPDSHAVDSAGAKPEPNVVPEDEDEGARGTKRGDGKPLSKLLYAAPEPLPSIPDFFWGRILSIQPLPMPDPAQAPETPDALPGGLGAFPFWRGEEDLHQALREIYAKATQKGMGIAE